jgi:fructokinase
LTGGTDVVAAIEAGGTKFVCAVGRTREEIRGAAKHVVPTTGPEETLRAVADWILDGQPLGPPAAVGVASFGPLDLAGGRIGPTPKPGWSGFDWGAAVRRYLPGAVLGLDTDTNGAALAEHAWGAARGLDVSVYVTVGTGIGGGVVIAGRPLHGLVHPEVGHMMVPRAPEDPFPGTCPFHGDCLEGMASGPAIATRWGARGDELGPGHPAWELESRYLGAAVHNLAMTLSPQVIILGGGVMGVPGLLDAVRARARAMIAGYVDSEMIRDGIDRFVRPPGLGPDSGVLGAFALGRQALAARS